MLPISSLKRLLSAIEDYENENDIRFNPGTYYFCMDLRQFDDPSIAFYPDIDNRFRSGFEALEYMFEEGLPIWLVRSHTNFPQNYYTIDKLETMFPNILD